MKKIIACVNVLFMFVFAVYGWANPPNLNIQTKKLPGQFHSPQPPLSQPADLRIISFNASPNPLLLPGSLKITATVKNFGGRSQATSMLFTLHGDIHNDMDVIERPKIPVQELAKNKTALITWDYHPVKPGRYTIGGQVDPDNRVTESNESNNVVPRVLQVQVRKGGADLDLVSLSVNHHRRHWYQKFIVKAHVTNRGNMKSGPFNVHLYRLFDKPAGWAQGSRKDTSKSCPSLAKGETCRVQFTFKYKVYVGNPHVSVTVDPEKKVNDYNRHNNTRKLHLTVF